MDIKYQLTKEGLDELKKMANAGSKNASESLSRLIDKQVKVETVAVRTIPVEKISDVIASPTDIVTTIIMNVHGEVSGNILLIYPEQSALNIADFLAKREFGSTTKLDELDKSALKESGNIISGAFLSAISNYLTINMVESVPDIATDMLKATMDSVLAHFTTKAPAEAVSFEIDFEMSTSTVASENIRAYFVLLLDVESAMRVMGSLKKISGGQKMTGGGL